MSIVLPLVGVAGRGNATLEIACIDYSVLGNTEMRVTPVLALTLLRKTNVTFVTHFYQLLFGSAIRGKHPFGHSVLGNTKVRYMTMVLGLRLLHKYMSILLPPFVTTFDVAVRGKATLKVLALVSPYSGKPKVSNVSDFNFFFFYIN